MNSKFNQELIEFACRFFENRGSVLEKNDQGLEVLLPENLSKILETDEHIKINTKTGTELEGAYSINYGSPLLDRIVDAVCRDLPLLICKLQFEYLKKEGFDSLIEKQFVFIESVGKTESRAVVNTEYIFLTCRYTAQSDEQKQGLISFVFNLETGSYVP
ncbi:MAG: hypothetical protein FJW56_05185, partial [Actinobacteria bacterium]|nr:hypothetical protein [Actinomycetota bacterium]